MKQREEKKMKAHAQCQLDEHLATAEREGPCSPFWPNPATTHGVSGCRAPGARLARALGGGVTVLRKSGCPGPSALRAARVSPAARGTNSLSRAVLSAWCSAHGGRAGLRPESDHRAGRYASSALGQCYHFCQRDLKRMAKMGST